MSIDTDWPSEHIAPVASVSINFPYGSLLRALVDADPMLLDRLDRWLDPAGSLHIRINERALTGTGLHPHGDEDAIVRGLQRLDRLRISCRPLAQDELRAFPSTWAKRLGFGRPTRAFLIEAVGRLR